MGPDAERIDLDGQTLRDDPARLADEAASFSMFGDKRCIRITGMGEESLPALNALLEAEAAGNPVTDYVSTRTFRVLRRDTLVTPEGYDVSLPVSETYSDFREVGGLVIPFKSVIQTPTMGTVRGATTKVELDVPLTDREFRP